MESISHYSEKVATFLDQCMGYQILIVYKPELLFKEMNVK